ncbi:MAG: Ldh family oxidoreductase [Betaproteobacteria bacterium]|nr:Ldh family oxidoreductase [Betaproteobacteria bacterium]
MSEPDQMYRSGGFEKKQPPDLVHLSAAEALELGERSMRRLGYDVEASRIVAENLVDTALCGYASAGLPRILNIADNPKHRQPRTAIRVVHETDTSALIDGGNNVGLYSVHRATGIAVEKARRSGFALVGVYNSFYSGRNADYLEMSAKRDLVGIHLASGHLQVVPYGGIRPALGTNPIGFGMPSSRGPVILDMGTAAIMGADVILKTRLNELLPEGVAVDGEGEVTRDPRKAREGGILTFGGHKGYGLSFCVQALGILAGAALNRDKDYGFLFIVFDPAMIVPVEHFKNELTALINRIKATPRKPGVPEILIPGERAFRERERRRVEGIELDRLVFEKLNAL